MVELPLVPVSKYTVGGKKSNLSREKFQKTMAGKIQTMAGKFKSNGGKIPTTFTLLTVLSCECSADNWRERV